MDYPTHFSPALLRLLTGTIKVDTLPGYGTSTSPRFDIFFGVFGHRHLRFVPATLDVALLANGNVLLSTTPQTMRLILVRGVPNRLL